MAKYQFEVLHGCHSEGKDEHGKPILYRKGDTVNTNTDLRCMNGPNSIKFRLVSTAGDEVNSPEVPTPPVPAPPQVSDTLATEREVYEEMTVADLRNYAESEEIDITGAKTKKELVDAIMAAEA